MDCIAFMALILKGLKKVVSILSKHTNQFKNNSVALKNKFFPLNFLTTTLLTCM